MLRSHDPTTAQRRPGAIAVKVAVLLPVLFGVIALSFDGGMIYDSRRQVHAAADAGALAAAGELFKTYSDGTIYTEHGLDPNGTIAEYAKTVARANLRTDAEKADIVVHIPPVSGPYTGQAGHAEVLISYPQRRGFSAILGRGDLPVGGRAVARGRWAAPGYGILVLDPKSSGALSIGGGAQGRVPNAMVLVNSVSPSAASGSGGNASLTATRFDVTGGISEQYPEQFNGPERTGIPPTPDPYRDVPEPDPTTMPSRSTRNMPVYSSVPDPMPTVNFTVSQVVNGVTITTHYLQPGVYVGGVRYTQGNVVLLPGVHYMLGGGFSFSGQGNLTAEGVMLFNDPGNNNGSVDIAGQGTVKWSPPTTGTYAGMTLFQKRGATTTVKIAGQGGMDITGALYVPNGLLIISGNGDNVIGTQVIVWQLSLQGNGTYYVPWDPGKLKPVRELKLVE